MTPVPLLITELVRIAETRGWSIADLADHLQVSPKSLYNLRLGNTALSLDLLSRIVAAFRDYQAIRELTIHFLGDEYRALGRSGHGRKNREGGPSALPQEIAYRDRWRICAWAARVPRAEGVRKGLYLCAANPRLLDGVHQFLRRRFDAAGVTCVSVPAHARLSASHAATALAARVLVVERVEHVGDDVARLLIARGDQLGATVVTSCVEREAIADAHLLRLFRASMQALRLDAAPPHVASHVPASLPASAA